jgi:hypothetical protein
LARRFDSVSFSRPALALVVACLSISSFVSPAMAGVLTKPIDPSQFSSVPFSSRSFWQQPWRAYLDTWPASRMRKGIGINFGVSAGEAPATAKLLASSGFRRARVELGWNVTSFEDPSKLSSANESSARARLLALRDNGIRPLILLNSNEREPTPSKVVTVTLLAGAQAGATSVQLDPSTSGSLVPRRSGFDFDGMAAGVLITSIDATGYATLSRPLPTALTAGVQPARILLQEPFAQPFLDNGEPNPRFERTLAGWLQYVKATTMYVKSVLGTDDFDVEIWNEVTFGARFLWNTAYYTVPPDSGSGDPKQVLLQRTVAFLRDPANGVPRVRIGDGFTNQTQLPAGSTEPVGVTAMDKHPYHSGAFYPSFLTFSGLKPIDALGKPNYALVNGAANDTFVPTFAEYMPEHFLTAFQTETLIRDLSPVTTFGWKNTPHGRYTHPPGGDPPEMWITEYNLPATARDAFIKPAPTADERDHLKAKVALRTLSAYLNKGATQVDLFAAKSSDAWQLIPQRFFDAIRANPKAYPTVDAGPVMRAVGRLAASMEGPDMIGSPRSLTLDRISDTHDNKIFEGNGTAAYPPLYDRDMLAFLPFQADTNRFVVPVYVMTTDLSKVYLPGAPAGTPGRMDLPDEKFELTVGGVDGPNTKVSYTDPITGATVAATITNHTATTVTIQVAATDYPRLLTITDGVDPVPTAVPVPMEDPNQSHSGATDSSAGSPPSGSSSATRPSIGKVRIVRKASASRVFVTVGCGSACNLKVVLRPVAGRSTARNTAVLFDRGLQFRAGPRRVLSLRLSRAATRWLAAHPRAWLRTTVTLREGGRTVAVRKLRLRSIAG